jgi:hypothetical protein
MVDFVKVTEAVQNALHAKGLPSNDLSKTPANLLPGAVGVQQFALLLPDCETEINRLCMLNLAWPPSLPAQNGQPFAQVYFNRPLSELIRYFYNYVTAPPAAGV